MSIKLRTPVDEDWSAILRVADEAAPWARTANRAWLENRRAYDLGGLGGSRYVTIRSGEIIGLVAIEGDLTDRWRVFIVAGADRLDDGTADALFDQLLADLVTTGGGTIWMREEARDVALLAFARRHGFIENQRFAFEGTQMVLLERGSS